MSGNSFVLASGNITIGDHHGVVHVAGMTIYMDVVWTTLIAAAIVLGLGLRMRAKATSGVPGKLQLIWELLVEQVTDLARSAIGPQGVPFVGLGLTIGLFVLVCNWLAFIPSGDPGFLAPPTGDVNLPLALALIVFFTVHYNSVKARGLRWLLQALRAALRRADADQHHRGDHQADHPDLPSLRQHLLGCADDHGDRHADPALPFVDRLGRLETLR